MNKIAINLNKEIPCEYICKQIEKLVTKFQQGGGNISESVLVIDIVQPIDGGDNHIKKLEYNPNSHT
jgi:hypothetical protein